MRIFVLVVVVFLIGGVVQAQDAPKVIQMTGVVFTTDSTSVIPGVHVYVPKAGRGTTTNPYGFFSLPVLEGDSIVLSAVGFDRKFFIVPKHDSEHSLRLITTMAEDIQFLEEVEVSLYPTEAMFKKAVLTVELPGARDYQNMNDWINAPYMASAYQQLNASRNQNYRSTMETQQLANSYRYQVPVNNFANPFAWARFIRDMRDTK